MSMIYEPARNSSKISYMYDPDATGVENGKPWKGIVIAKMVGCNRDVVEFINDLPAAYVYADVNTVDKLFLENEYTGIAHCSTDDEWNLNEGKRIARTRMLRKYTIDKRNALRAYFNYIAKCGHKVMAEIHKCTEQIKKHKNDIEKEGA